MVAPYTGYGNAPPSDLVSNDYQGSYQEWKARVVASLSARYAAGDQGLLDNLSGATGPIGQPAGTDFGKNTESLQTRQFWERYVDAYGKTDPYLAQQFGAPPDAQATYEPNPNSQSAVQAGVNATSTANAATQAASSKYQTDTQAATAAAQIASNNAQAALDDATKRYIAQGDWGIQTYVADSNNKGQLDRLMLQLGDNAKDRADRAVAEQNRHHESMLNLVMQVAQYDATLASEPKNWLAYASWLNNRGVVVNGLSLAMVADMVPAASISPAESASQPGGGITAFQQAAVQQQTQAQQPAAGSQAQAQGLVTGASGGSVTPQANAAAATSQPAQMPATVNGVDLNSTDYAGIARKLLGMNTEASSGAPSLDQLNAASANLQTNAGQRVPGFQNYAGPTTNNLGMTVQPMGQKDDYRQFSHLLPSQQDMRLGEIKSIGEWQPDYLKAMQNARPQGNFTGSAAYG